MPHSPAHPESRPANHLFLIWKEFQRRPETLATHFPMRLEYVVSRFTGKMLKPLDYAVKAMATLGLLVRVRPAVAWLQIPPNILAHLVLLFRALFARNMVVVLDGHNGAFRAPWSRTPFMRWVYRSADLTLVHNADMIEPAVALGVPRDRLLVLEDRSNPLRNAPAAVADASGSVILVPCSFAADEPIEALFAAARRTPEITYKITGNPARAKPGQLDGVPPNCHITGFLSRAEYDRLLSSCTALMGLTIHDGIQLSAANEGVAAGKPMILSRTATLTALFEGGTVFVESTDPASIAAGAREAVANAERLRAGTLELRDRRDRRWLLQAAAVDEAIHRIQAQRSGNTTASRPARSTEF